MIVVYEKLFVLTISWSQDEDVLLHLPMCWALLEMRRGCIRRSWFLISSLHSFVMFGKLDRGIQYIRIAMAASSFLFPIFFAAYLWPPTYGSILRFLESNCLADP